MLNIILSIALLSAIAMLIYSWRTNVAPGEKNFKTKEHVVFYDNDNYVKRIPIYTSDFKFLDNGISDDVRLNCSMYYDKDTFEKYKEQVLKENIPV